MEIAFRRREQEVWQACDDLWAQHGDLKHLTGDIIRERLVTLGKSRGSPNEIYKYRRSWTESRGVSSADQVVEPHNDPISRAVRLVHENLKNETDKELERLEKEFEQKLKEKDEELTAKNQALDRVMQEFHELNQALLKNQNELNSQALQLTAEIEVRKAMERDVARLVALREQERAGREELLTELKLAHQQERLKAESAEAEERALAHQRLGELIEQNKLQGHSYSEKLTEQKIITHQQEVANKVLASKNAELLEEKEVLREQILSKNKKLEVFKEEHDKLLQRSAAQLATIELSGRLEKEQQKERQTLLHRLKKAELSVARLRTLLHGR